VRELENVLGHACMMTESDVIDVRDLPERIQNQKPSANDPSEEMMSLEHLSRRHAQRVLAHAGGNKARAAEILGISRTYLYELLKKIAPEQEPAAEDVEDEESKLPASKK
jgi:DNA-binding NtrC family response regulator